MKCSITCFSIKNYKHFYFFFVFSGIFVVDFKIFVKLSNTFFTFMSSSSLSSLEINLVFFKILIFRGEILKNVYKEIPSSLLYSIFPLYTLTPNSEFEKNWAKNSFSPRKMQLEDLSIIRSIDNCLANYIH